MDTLQEQREKKMAKAIQEQGGGIMDYNKMETVEKYGTVLDEDKSISVREEVAEELYSMLKDSPYTFGELLDCLGWEKWKLERILAGDEEIGLYELTHITGALGKSFKVEFL